MSFALADWMLYTLWAAFGLMLIDFLIAFVKSFWKGSFSPTLVLDYLKDVLYFIFPLNILISMLSIDPSGWILVTFYFIGGIAISLKYLFDIYKKFK
ncbi:MULTISPECIES: hypothetical protein [Neobacillus]|jgi:hypothetical protein|uniref:Uncharacterized protein n=2 Tax=Neobacillus TaxID=2675232 RepID=A0A942U5B6_9BACI|nr:MULTISPECIES: hypothetical protein [Neobacillus]MBS4211299.1 hypothetical protein [Neobacillus rhizophilus]MBU8918821.1 hypothetical protein [Bacillus sp. FJAT-29953]MCH6266876.1 hypothetical protein [Neobacillus citreus]